MTDDGTDLMWEHVEADPAQVELHFLQAPGQAELVGLAEPDDQLLPAGEASDGQGLGTVRPLGKHFVVILALLGAGARSGRGDLAPAAGPEPELVGEQLDTLDADLFQGARHQGVVDSVASGNLSRISETKQNSI